MFEEQLATLEGGHQVGILRGRCFVFVTAGHSVIGGSQRSTREPFLSLEARRLLADVFVVFFTCGTDDAIDHLKFIALRAGSQRHAEHGTDHPKVRFIQKSHIFNALISSLLLR